MITGEYVYYLIGLFFAAVAIQNLLDRTNPNVVTRVSSFVFWGLAAILVAFGAYLKANSPFLAGCMVIVIVVMAGVGLGKTGAPPAPDADREKRADRFGNTLFLPALLIPLLTVAIILLMPYLDFLSLLIAKAQVSFVALGVSAVVALIVGLLMLRETPATPLVEGRHLLDTLSWTALLPLLLAALGQIFLQANVGGVIGSLLTQWLPLDITLVAVVAYGLGMAVLTILTGNAFAAFPIMVTALGIPIIVTKLGGDVAGMAAVGMLSGFCGTLLTPLAANFNVVPARLLELENDYAVIRVQVATGLALLVFNIGLMYFFLFKH